jgi:predicted amidophosphoribosyltransferase
MNLFQLDFGSLLTYCPRGTADDVAHSRDVMQALKRDKYVGKQKILMSEWVARAVKQKISVLPFADFFQSNTILVPVPKSSLMQPHSLWVPQRIAEAFASVGIGKVSSCLIRSEAVPKAALSSPSERPTAERHYNSLTVQGILEKPEEIVLVDDVITRGATLIGCANRLIDAFPECRIRAFAAMRTISYPSDFQKEYLPCQGTIDLCETGDTFRRP